MLNQVKNTWVVTQLVDKDCLDFWRNRLKDQTPEDFQNWHPARQQGYLNCRMAMAECYLKLTGKNLSSFQIQDHHSLEQDPAVLISLSHTSKFAVCWMALANQEVQGLGVDIELSDRVVTDKILEFIAHSCDSRERRPSLEYWCMKEASFKSFTCLKKERRPKGLRDVWVQRNQFGSAANNSLGDIQVNRHQQGEQELVIAFASFNSVREIETQALDQ